MKDVFLGFKICKGFIFWFSGKYMSQLWFSGNTSQRERESERESERERERARESERESEREREREMPVLSVLFI